MHIIPLTQVVQDEILPVVCILFTLTISIASDSRTKFPFWVVVSFGAYLLFKLGWGVFTFNDVPEAHKELMGEIGEAKRDLRNKGIDVD